MLSHRLPPTGRSPLAPVRDDRGLALITALIALMLLAALVVVFAALSATEPAIARNQLRAAQARAVAESGVERALWALTRAGAIPSPFVGAIAPAPYDGSAFFPVGTIGGFFVTVGAGGAANERAVDAVGWVPTHAAAALQTSHKHIRLTVTQVRWINPQGAFSVGGDLRADGSAVTIDSSQDGTCGHFSGTYTSGTVSSRGSSPAISGWDGTPPRTEGVPSTTFEQYTFTNSNLDQLKALAKAQATYFQGATTFDSSHPWPTSGIVFVDTPSGNNLNCTASPDPTCANPAADLVAPLLTITGTSRMPVLNGWLVVNGSIDWSGNATVNGLVYAQDDVRITGGATIAGAVVAKNVVGVSSTSVDSTAGNVSVTYDCHLARTGNGTIPTGWYVKQGSYREVPD